MAQEEKKLYVGIEYVCLSGRVGELGSQETAGTDSAVCPWQSGCPLLRRSILRASVQYSTGELEQGQKLRESFPFLFVSQGFSCIRWWRLLIVKYTV